MSFKDDYKKQMDTIRTDGYIRQKISKKMSEEENKKTRLHFPVFKTAVAAVMCLVIALAVAIPKVSDSFKKSDNANLSVNESSKVKIDYSDIYDKVKELKNFYYAEEYATDTMDGATAIGATGSTTKNSANGGVSSDGGDTENYSATTTQVQGVDEADVIKTDGEYIYSLSAKNKKVYVTKAGKTPEQVAVIPIEGENAYSYNAYLYEDRLVVFGTEYSSNSAKTVADIYDISIPKKPQKITECSQDGNYTDSRLIGDKLYVISNYSINTANMEKKAPETYVPNIYCGDYQGACPADSVYIGEVCEYPQYTVIAGYDITDGSLCSTQSVLGGTYTVYCSTENIITANTQAGSTTVITRYAINDGKIELKAEGRVDGTLLNQFSIDEYNGYFRFVTTVYKTVFGYGNSKYISTTNSSNALYVLNGELEQVGAIEDLAPDERVYSVRFMGDMAYFVTFRQVDPLFSADLTDPNNPKIVGSLKIPGFSEYLYPFGDGKLLGLGREADEQTGKTGDVKLSMFDISDPANVTESDKTAITDMQYTTALDNHKATLVSTDRNLVGFYGYSNNYLNHRYVIYSYDGGFVKKAEIGLSADIGNVRGFYIGNEFYITTDYSLQVYDLESFELICELKYK